VHTEEVLICSPSVSSLGLPEPCNLHIQFAWLGSPDVEESLKLFSAASGVAQVLGTAAMLKLVR